MRTASQPSLLRTRAAALALTARCLGPDPSVLSDHDHLDALRTALDQAHDHRAAERLTVFDPDDLPATDELSGRWVRWFDLGRVAPYEGSNVVTTAGGVTPRLADIAGFYRSFGMAVSGDRADHVVAELEFLALALIHEAEAVDDDDHDRAEVTRDVIRSFVRDHVGTWLDAWAARVGEIAELAPWAPFAAVAAQLVGDEAAMRNVIPTRSNSVHVVDDGVPDPTEPLLACGDDEPVGI